MPKIDDSIIDKIRDSLDIAEVISGYIPLKRAGRNFRANCPFHHEKTPSFMVSPEKQIFHCFGCGEGGNIFNFVMKYEKLDFPEAVRFLAEKAGVEISKYQKEERGSSDKDRILKANELAADFYHNTLMKDKAAGDAKAYLKNRLLKEDTLYKFKIGYAPSGWNLFLRYAASKGFDNGILEKAGLIIAGRDGHYDRFRNRIIFPILDVKNKAVAFGGRVLDDSIPKYLNSPETEVYIKGRNLYGLNLCGEDIRKKDSVVIVEGYLDLISLFQAGFKNAVATLGTALTAEQVKLLKRFTKNVVVLFDADQAGQIASLRGLDLLLEEDLNVDVAGLPIGYDPDKFVCQYGAESFRKYVESAKDFFKYKLDVLLSIYDRNDIRQKAAIIGEMLPTLLKVRNNIIKAEYIKALSQILSVDEGAVRRQMADTKSAVYQAEYSKKPSAAFEQEPARPAERHILKLIFEDNSFLAAIRQSLDILDFKDPAVRSITSYIYELHDKDEAIKPSKLIDYFNDEFYAHIISQVSSDEIKLTDKEKCLHDCIRKIKKDNHSERCRLLRDRIKLAESGQDHKHLTELITEYNNLIKCQNL